MCRAWVLVAAALSATAAGADLELRQLQSAAGRRATRAAGDFGYTTFQLANWPGLPVDGNMCNGTGGPGAEFQAPINFDLSAYYAPVAESPLFYIRDGGCETAYFLNKPGAWQVDFINKPIIDCENLEMVFGGKVWVQVQFHFHTLSEDTLDFKPLPLQLHMVHTDGTGFAVVGVLIKTGAFQVNAFLKNVFDVGFYHNRNATNPSGKPWDPYTGLLVNGSPFWLYQGSFTTPPCTGGVQFLIQQQPVVTSPDYVEAYMNFLKTRAGNSYGQNHRPPQPLNGRSITVGLWGLRNYSAFPAPEPLSDDALDAAERE